MPNNTLSDREVRRIAKVVLDYERRVNVPSAKRAPPISDGSVGGGDGTKLYRFTLNASLAGGTADADILEMDGTDTGIDDDVLDPLGIFSSLTVVNSAGLCLKQGGKYYVIQAPCPA